MARADRGAVGTVYNIGGESEIPNIELVRRLLALSQAGVADPVRDRSPRHDRRYAMDSAGSLDARVGAAARLHGRAGRHGRVVLSHRTCVGARV